MQLLLGSKKHLVIRCAKSEDMRNLMIKRTNGENMWHFVIRSVEGGDMKHLVIRSVNGEDKWLRHGDVSTSIILFYVSRFHMQEYFCV